MGELREDSQWLSSEVRTMKLCSLPARQKAAAEGVA